MYLFLGYQVLEEDEWVQVSNMEAATAFAIRPQVNNETNHIFMCTACRVHQLGDICYGN